MNPEKPRNFAEFWPIYMLEHKKPANRRCHFIGTAIGFTCLAVAAVTGNPWFIFLAFVVGYSFAWIGHLFIEKNRPATFKYPLYSLFGDYRMFYLILNRKLDAEMARLSELRTKN
jgi:hypothetical protein